MSSHSKAELRRWIQEVAATSEPVDLDDVLDWPPVGFDPSSSTDVTTYVQLERAEPAGERQMSSRRAAVLVAVAAAIIAIVALTVTSGDRSNGPDVAAVGDERAATSPADDADVNDDADLQTEPAVELEAVQSEGCRTALAEPGAYQGTNEFADGAQDYWVVVPDGYVDMAPVPLIFILSAGFGDADVNYEWWRPYLDDTESLFVIAAAPGSGTEPWLPSEVHVALIDKIGLDYCIDMRRVHTAGYSSSAKKAIRLACDAPDRIASVAASISLFQISCEPTRPIPLLAFTGDDDRVGTTSSVEWWAEFNGCDPEPVDVDLGSGVTRRTYEGCSASVVLYDIAGAGHGVFFRTCIGSARTTLGSAFCQENAVVDQVDEMEMFFAEHPHTSLG